MSVNLGPQKFVSLRPGTWSQERSWQLEPGAELPLIDPQASIFSYNGLRPKIDPDVFVAAGARVVGEVELGAQSTVWYNVVIRGDVHYVKVGPQTNIQDLAMLHVTHETNPLEIGSRVTVGHSAKIHGCTIKDKCLIGIGSVVLDGAVIGESALVAAGAVVRPGMEVPPRTMVAGVPAKIIRELSLAEIEDMDASADRYISYAQESLRSFS